MVTAARPSRGDYYRVLVDGLPKDALVVTCLGNASYLWATMHHVPENFYVEDAMGLALPLALGLSVAQPKRRVVVVEGDGGLMMHLGVLVTLGAVAPVNLTVLLIQNGVHAASGGQVLTNPALDLASLARSSGIASAENIETPQVFSEHLGTAIASDGPHVLVLSTEPDIEVVKPPVDLDPVLVKHRFMIAINAPRYVSTLFGGGRLES
ncbi:MAG: thiamine pyrophosphate-dependent enzyme [Pseudomonadota bacterium]|nr:thiamine pyrophosphate-dependent enzyme [Pseudomonadota bacterium]